MKKYIFIALLVVSLGVATPARAMHMAQPTREEIMIQLIATLTELVKQLQAQPAIALAQEARSTQGQVEVVNSKGVGEVKTFDIPFEVRVTQGMTTNNYSLGGNCNQIVFESNKTATMYNPESQSWTGEATRFFFRPQATSTTLNLIFIAGSQRVDQEVVVGEAIDRSATTGQQFDYQLGKCK